MRGENAFVSIVEIIGTPISKYQLKSKSGYDPWNIPNPVASLIFAFVNRFKNAELKNWTVKIKIMITFVWFVSVWNPIFLTRLMIISLKK